MLSLFQKKGATMKRFILIAVLVFGFAALPARAQEDEERPRCTVEEMQDYVQDAQTDLETYAVVFQTITEKTQAEAIELYLEAVNKQQGYMDARAEIPACLLPFSTFMETQINLYTQAIGMMLVVFLNPAGATEYAEEVSDIAVRIQEANETLEDITTEVLAQLED